MKNTIPCDSCEFFESSARSPQQEPAIERPGIWPPALLVAQGSDLLPGGSRGSSPWHLSQ